MTSVLSFPLLLIGLLFLLSSGTNGFRAVENSFGKARRSIAARSCSSSSSSISNDLSSSSSSGSNGDDRLTISSRVPVDRQGVLNDMIATLRACIEDNGDKYDEDSNIMERNSRKLMRVDVLTPGLNPKLEQKAMLTQDVLFDLVLSMLPILMSKHKKMKIMFPSMGDAAAFLSYTASQIQKSNRREFQSIYTELNERIILTDLRGGGLDPINTRVDEDDKFALIVNAKNLVGDNCLKTIQDITERFPSLNVLLLNCDIGDKVSSGGMTERTKRDGYRKQYKQIYYFRNIVTIQRPVLMPYELGAIICRAKSAYVSPVSLESSLPESESLDWKIYACNHNGGPGSLNRFMKVNTFPIGPDDPTAERPPKFVQVGAFDLLPNRNEIDVCMQSAGSAIASMEAKLKREAALRVDSRSSAINLLKSSDAYLGDFEPKYVYKALEYLSNLDPEPINVQPVQSVQISASTVPSRMSILDIDTGSVDQVDSDTASAVKIKYTADDAKQNKGEGGKKEVVEKEDILEGKLLLSFIPYDTFEGIWKLSYKINCLDNTYSRPMVPSMMEVKKSQDNKGSEFTITTYDGLGFLKMNSKSTTAEYNAAEQKFMYPGTSGVSCKVCMMYIENDSGRNEKEGRVLIAKILQGSKVLSIEYWKSTK